MLDAWTDFHDRMKAVGERITGDEFPGDPRMRAEGFRYLNRLSMFAQQLYLEFSDPRVRRSSASVTTS